MSLIIERFFVVIKNKFSEIISTFFYAGYFPGAPGSFASALAVLLCFLLHQNTGIYILVFIVLTALGFTESSKMEEIKGKKDPGCVVIDEVSGMMIACFLLPFTWPVVWSTFFLFRAFDMFKIYPGNIFESVGGSKGIMMDDIIAGIYTNITMHIAIRLAGGI